MKATLAGPRGPLMPADAGALVAPRPAPASVSVSASVRVSTAAPAERAQRWRSVAVGAGVLALLALFSLVQGGYAPIVWLGGALAAVALWLWARLTFGAAPALGPAGRAALLTLAIYTVWSYVSVAWAADPGAAVSGSDRTLLYLVLFVLGVGIDWTSRRLELALASYALVLGAIATVTLVGLARHLDPGALQAGALASPIGYHNGTAALGTIGALSAILLAGSRTLAVPLRGVLAAAATACLEMSLLADSRGWLYTLPVIVVVVILLAPDRGRVCAWALVPVVATLATLPWILRVYAPSSGAVYGAASERASAAIDIGVARAALVALVLSGLLTAALASIDRAWRLAPAVRRVSRRLAGGLLALALLGAAAGGALLISDGTVARALRQFTRDASVRPGVVRFAQLGGDRFDFWRVGWQSFLAHPLGGLGQDNFAQAYTQARHSLEEPTWVHSLELRLLSGTGLVGFLLFAGFTALALTGALRSARAGGARRRALIAVALVPEAVWLIHGSFDWFWEIPALAAPAFWWLGVALAREPRRRFTRVEPRRRLTRASLGGAHGRAMRSLLAAAAAALALVVLGSAYLAERALGQASALADSAPHRALAELRQARALAPFDYTPLALGAAIELRLGDPGAARTDVSVGLSRDHTSWLLWLEDGLADGAAGQRAAELRALARARALDPREAVIALAQRLGRDGHSMTIAQAAGLFAVREREVIGE